MSEGNYRENTEHGVWKIYHKNGQLHQVVPYQKGEVHGELVSYARDGAEVARCVFENGEPVDGTVVYFFGTPRQLLVTYRQGKKKHEERVVVELSEES